MTLTKTLITNLVSYKYKVITTQELKELCGFKDDNLYVSISQLIKLGIVKPFNLKRGIYIKDGVFTRMDYLYLSQKIEPKSIIGGETSLSMYGILKKTPQSCVSYILTNSKERKEYTYGSYSYSYVFLTEKLYLLGITTQSGLNIYEPEKAYLDCVYIESLKGKVYDDYGIFFSQLKVKKIELYIKYYPSIVQSHVKKRFLEELNINLNLNNEYSLESTTNKDFSDNSFDDLLDNL